MGTMVIMIGDHYMRRFKSPNLYIQDDAPRIETADGHLLPTLVTAKSQVGMIISGEYEHQVVMSAQKLRQNCIIGADFFSD